MHGATVKIPNYVFFSTCQ